MKSNHTCVVRGNVVEFHKSYSMEAIRIAAPSLYVKMTATSRDEESGLDSYTFTTKEAAIEFYCVLRTYVYARIEKEVEEKKRKRGLRMDYVLASMWLVIPTVIVCCMYLFGS